MKYDMIINSVKLLTASSLHIRFYLTDNSVLKCGETTRLQSFVLYSSLITALFRVNVYLEYIPGTLGVRQEPWMGCQSITCSHAHTHSHLNPFSITSPPSSMLEPHMHFVYGDMEHVFWTEFHWMSTVRVEMFIWPEFRMLFFYVQQKFIKLNSWIQFMFQIKIKHPSFFHLVSWFIYFLQHK